MCFACRRTLRPVTPHFQVTFDLLINLTRLFDRFYWTLVHISITVSLAEIIIKNLNNLLRRETGLDDNCVDDVLGDGIHDQDLFDNDCYKEIQSHMSLRNVSRDDYKTINAEEAIKALITDSAALSDATKKLLHDYQVLDTVLRISLDTAMIMCVCVCVTRAYSFSFFHSCL